MKFSTAAVATLYATSSISWSFVQGEENADSGGQYTNPCEELGTAKILNELYYDVSSLDGCHHGKPSYYCSGMFFHGLDPFMGTGLTPSAEGTHVVVATVLIMCLLLVRS